MKYGKSFTIERKDLIKFEENCKRKKVKMSVMVNKLIRDFNRKNEEIKEIKCPKCGAKYSSVLKECPQCLQNQFDDHEDKILKGDIDV